MSTHPRAFEQPLDVGTARAVVQEWLRRPNVTTYPGLRRHDPGEAW